MKHPKVLEVKSRLCEHYRFPVGSLNSALLGAGLMEAYEIGREAALRTVANRVICTDTRRNPNGFCKFCGRAH